MITFNEIDTGDFMVQKESLKPFVKLNPVFRKMYFNPNSTYNLHDDQRGANCKFWIKSSAIPNGLLFKYPELRSNGEIMANSYGELLVSLICDRLDISHTPYYPCRFQLKNGTTLVGTICPSYRTKEYDTEYSASNITTRYIQSQYDNNYGKISPIKYNTVYEYLKEIKDLYPKVVQVSGINQLKTSLLKLALLDFATMQVDRHWGNFGFLNNSQKGMRTIMVTPIFDNGCSFNGDKPISKMSTLSHAIDHNRKWEKHVIDPMIKGKENAPLLGIKTPLVTLKDEHALIKRKYYDGEPSNVEIFADEITNEILENKNIARFYQSMCKLDVEEIFEKSAYFPPEVINVASKIWQGRMKILENCLEQKRSNGYEN